jgi:membrane-bound lytic murein transglycosylase A
MLKKYYILLLCVLCIFTGCYPGVLEKPEVPLSLEKLKPGEYPVFSDAMNYNGLLDSIDNSLVYFKRIPQQRAFNFENETYTAAHMIRSLETFKTFIKTNPSENALNKWIKKNFLVYKAAGNNNGEVLFTGYFEPIYQGSLKQDTEFAIPIYSIPDDLFKINLSLFSEQYKGHKTLIAKINEDKKQVEPYYTRKELEARHDFYKIARPVAWLKSRVDRFFLEIQGSGQIDLGNGQILKVGYAGVNGRPYSSIGKYLIEQNEIPKEEMSMQAIRQWLDLNPDRIDEVLNKNESYVFFKEETDGPYGSIGVKLTNLRSVATDLTLFPRGALCFIETWLPDKNSMDNKQDWKQKSFFVMNQDTGGAIKGPARADLFCGNGNYAEFTAGHMQHYGHVFFLVLKGNDNDKY